MNPEQIKELWRILKNAEWNLSGAIANPNNPMSAVFLDMVLYDLRIAISKLAEEGGAV